jgi:hypothetical protein
MEYLRAAGYSNRKAARKAFFQKARVSILRFEIRVCANICRSCTISTTR